MKVIVCFYQIPKLTEGKEYIMRISAENLYGISDPLESEEMRAKDLFSTFYSLIIKLISEFKKYFWRNLSIPESENMCKLHPSLILLSSLTTLFVFL